MMRPKLLVSMVVLASVMLAAAPTARGERTVWEVSWAKQKAAGKLLGGEAVVVEGQEPSDQLRVVNPHAKATRVTVLTLVRPPVKTAVYAIVGQLRHEGVEGRGFMEMWSHFSGGDLYFTRTLARRGPMKHLAGSSGWRRFVLPFRPKGGERPRRLVVNVALAGRGTVVLGPLRLVEYDPGEDPLALPGQWWGERMGGLIGGSLGALMGCLGAATGVLASRGKARGFVMGALKTMFAFGLVCAAAGLAALVDSQPYAVFYPLLLLGVLCSVLPVGLRRTAGKRYEQLELRRMAAQDMA